MVPDFVRQVIVTHRDLMTQSSYVAEVWQDSVQERYYDAYIKPFDIDLEIYVKGGSRIVGKGLDELLIFLDQKQRDMEMLGRL